MPTDIYLNLEALSTHPDIGLALAWLCAGNDIGLAFHLEAVLKKERDASIRPSEFAEGGRFYLLRIACSQAYEALKLCRPTKDSEIMKLIRESEDAHETFVRLDKLNDAKPKDNPDRALLDRIRNQGAFHYYDWRDKHIPAWLQDAIQGLVADGHKRGEITEHENAPHRYGFADAAYNRMFVREIFDMRTPEDEPVSREQMQRITSLVANLAMDVRVVAHEIGHALVKRYPLNYNA
jgi:hypothetical protein